MKFHDGSYAQFAIPMGINSDGYTTTFSLSFNIRSIKTSLNQHAFIESTSFALSGILPTTIKWNSRREWIFTLNAEKPKIFLLKEHTELFADLGRDFSFGPLIPLEFFIPITYTIKGVLLNYQGFFCANQFNVIAVHNDLDENCRYSFNFLKQGYLTLSGSQLEFYVSTNFEEYDALDYQIPIAIDVYIRSFF